MQNLYTLIFLGFYKSSCFPDIFSYDYFMLNTRISKIYILTNSDFYIFGHKIFKGINTL